MSTNSNVAQAILLHASPQTGQRLARADVLKAANVKSEAFRYSAEGLGAKASDRGLAFFDTSERGKISFGPGAGLAVGVSVGAETVRAVLVDVNGWTYHHHESEHVTNQLDQHPATLIARIGDAIRQVLADTFEHTAGLLVNGCLPLLGYGVAWPTSIDRDYKPNGNTLSHAAWRGGQRLTGRIAQAMRIEEARSYALNDAHAAAIAVAYRDTHLSGYHDRRFPKLTLVIRLAGNIGAGIIIVEHPRRDQQNRIISGFPSSILLAGFDNHAGEIGHAPVAKSTLAKLARNRPKGLPSLTAQPCTCSAPGDPTAEHLQAYASVLALTRRIDPRRSRRETLKKVLANPTNARHERALMDTGALVADTLLGPVATLNPGEIVLTGSLAIPIVKKEIQARIENAHKLGTTPIVSLIDDQQENDFLRAQGAALAIIRRSVHRRLDELLDNGSFGGLTKPLSREEI